MRPTPRKKTFLERGYQAMSFGSRVARERFHLRPRRRGRRVADARPRRAGDDRAGPHCVLVVAEDADAFTLEHDEDLLLRGVAGGQGS